MTGDGDYEAMERVSRTISPDDIDRRMFYAKALGLYRQIRLLVILAVVLEIVGRLLQVLYIAFPDFGAH